MSCAVGRSMLYGRELLLHGEKRNAVLDLPEIHRFGIDSYGDANYVSIYGLQPAQWHACGIRLLGRTAVECTRDELASAIGRDVAALTLDSAHALIVDPFAGSGNTLYWLLRISLTSNSWNAVRRTDKIARIPLQSVISICDRFSRHRWSFARNRSWTSGLRRISPWYLPTPGI